MKNLAFLLLILCIIGCDSTEPSKFKYDIIVTDSATNLKELNSVYDDYNSNLPYPAERMDIHFSSNRNSIGKNFDIITGVMDFSYHADDKVLNVSVSNDIPSFGVDSVLKRVNTGNNEFGPYSYYTGKDLLFLYATQVNGFYKILFVENTNWNYAVTTQKYSGPLGIATINEMADNLYPTITSGKKEMYFCSNQNDTVFNIYTAFYNSEITKQSLIDGNISKIEKNTILSSAWNDKCPFIKENFIIFSSNREGGFGGYDLWYSEYTGNSWSIPVNMGDKINTEYDEYRPVLFNVLGFDMVIFSSNRPGGKGGYDLYIARTGIME